MRRILLVGDYPPPHGGVSVQVASLRGHLAARADTEVRVLDIGVRRRERRPGCLPVRGPVHFAAAVLRHAAAGFLPHLHTNGHNAKSWVVTLCCTTAGLAGGRRAVVSLGSGRMPDYLDVASPVTRAVVRAGLALARSIIVRNERARAALEAFGISPRKIVVLPGFYGVAEREIGPLPEDVADFRRMHAPLLGAIATRGPEYGLSVLIDAAARLRARHPRLGVVLIGPDQLEDGCPRWVLPAGEQDRSVLLAALKAVDVFVRPTYFDGDASSVREALALGVRVVASATDFRPEGVRRFPPGDADALAETIEAALASDPTRVAGSSLPELLAVYDAPPSESLPPAARQDVMPDTAVGDASGRLRLG